MALGASPPPEALAEMHCALGDALTQCGNLNEAASAYLAGSRQPATFHFSQICQQRCALLSVPGAQPVWESLQ
jgi:hypothetical protein